MSIVIPYDKTLGYDQGALITPDGKLLYVGKNHEDYARRYCNGTEYEYEPVTGAHIANKTRNQQLEYQIRKTAKDIGENPHYFSTSKLSKEQLEKYRLWLETMDTYSNEEALDFLVLVLAFDKVETNVHNIITTTSAIPHIRFYNYYLMNWQILVHDRMVYDPEQNKYVYSSDNQTFTPTSDREAEEEIQEIKKTIKFEYRPYFFKNWKNPVFMV